MIDFKLHSSPTGASLPPPSQQSIVSDSSYSTETPPEKCQPPPWQVKWKRPRLDRVALGIDAPDNTDDCVRIDFFEDNRDDWIPISSSSVVLTRNEARSAILELYKRDKLLVKKKRQIHEIVELKEGIVPKYNSAHTVIRTPTKVVSQTKKENLNEDTPRNSNVKKSPAVSPSTLFSLSSWFKKSTEDVSSQSSPVKQSTESKPAISGPNAKPPRFQRKNKTERSLLSPPTSTLFTTFSNVTTRPPISHSRQHRSPQNDEVSSPPTITDASTASSLLWEDNTLTSVSEEDVVAFRMYENSKLRQSGGPGVGASSISKNDGDDHDFFTAEERQAHQSRDQDDEDDNFGGGRYYCDRHGNLRLSDWDGFDNVVLSVTVYAVASYESNPIENVDSTNQKCPPSSGEVVVMELLSTKNPPSLEWSDARSGKLKKFCSPSLSHTNMRPPPPPTTSLKGGSISRDESDASAVSSASNTEQQQQLDDDDGDEASSNHPRILARRVFRWPSSLMSLESKKRSRPARYLGTLYSNFHCCPSFVQLGRTSVWDARTVDEKQQSGANRKEVVHSTYQEERAADAIDAIRCLDFLFGESNNKKPAIRPNSLSKKDTIDAEDSSAANDSHSNGIKTRQPLCLCFVTNDGYVHFFHAMRVFLSRSSINKADISNSFAALLLGEELLTKVFDDIMPLNYPHVSLKLSQVTSSRNDGDFDTDLAMWNAILSIPRRANPDVQAWDIAEREAERKNDDWARLIDFDASIDPMSLRYRTLSQSNVATGACITSNHDNAFLAICGKGLASKNSHTPSYSLGGFITFVSLRHCNEVRSIYLPFAINRIQPVYWNGLHFVILLGEGGCLLANENDQKLRLDGQKPFAMAIRVDSKPQHPTKPDKSRCNSYPDRFKPVVINLSSVSESLGPRSRDFFQEGDTIGFNAVRVKAMSVSNIPSSPPGIIMSLHSKLPKASHFTAVVNHTLSSFSDGCFSTVIQPGHRLCLDQINHESNVTAFDERDIWCTGGQGWSLVGIQGNIKTSYYISWDGSTDSQGPYVLKLTDIHSTDHQAKMTIQSQRTVVSCVMPLLSFVTRAENMSRCATSTESQNITASLPFTSTYSLPPFMQTEQRGKFSEDYFSELPCSEALRESIISTARNEGGIDDVLVSALGSISNSYSSLEERAQPYRSNALVMSHEQKSKRLLQHCSSWTQLDDTRANRGIVHGQVMSTIIRVGSYTQALTLRTNIVMNPLTTSFDQVLSWLCQRRDYYTAASVALSLLDDVEAVYELRGISKERNGEQTSHQGLLDNITPLTTNAGAPDNAMHVKTLTSLADMTVGCLIKGGISMGSTLEGFLTRNKLYDSSRASLMLVGTIALVISSEPSLCIPCHRKNRMNIVERLSKAESPSEAAMWPIKCLLKMAVARNCLSSALLMLNATIPNELRWRSPQVRGLAAAQRPSLGLFLAVVDTILESTPESTRSLLDLVDEDSGLSYWLSIEDDTRLALSLFSVHGKHVMIQQPEVRHWIVDRLKKEIESSTQRTFDDCCLPDEWLREVISGVLCNAECDICLGLEAMRKTPVEPTLCFEDFECYREDMICVRDLLIPQKDSGGLDFDILIPSLLLLSLRGLNWREGSSIHTQILLNTVCDLAGRKTSCTPWFLFDGRTAMRQCALTGNVQATSFLIGGRSGLVLECADLLIAKTGLSMKDAENALFGGSLVELKELKMNWDRKNNTDNSSHSWSPTRSHRHILWLIQHHILNARNYGEFDSPSTQGKATPVTAGRICFRAWYFLTGVNDINAAAKWLETWLRHKLDLQDGISPKRLSCAALVRVLLWADEECSVLDLNEDEDDQILGAMVGLDFRFMAELSHACIGLILSIPPSLQSDILRESNASAIFSFEVEGHQNVLPFNGRPEL